MVNIVFIILTSASRAAAASLQATAYTARSVCAVASVCSSRLKDYKYFYLLFVRELLLSLHHVLNFILHAFIHKHRLIEKQSIQDVAEIVVILREKAIATIDKIRSASLTSRSAWLRSA